MAARTRNNFAADRREARRKNLRKALNPQSIVLIGGAYLSRNIFELRETGFRGTIHVVNPKVQEIEGLTVIPTIADLPEVPDLALLAVNADMTISYVKELSDLGVACAVCYAHQFAEIGGIGIERQRALVDVSGDMAVLGPNGTGFVNYLDGVVAAFGDYLAPFRDRGVAIITQSGSVSQYAVHGDRNCPIGYMITLGNQAVITVADTIEAMLDDDRVTAIGIYMEGLTDAEAFARAALHAIERNIPIIVLNPGRSEQGRKAAQSHTASMTSDSAVLDSICHRYGIIRAVTMSQWIETLKLINGIGVPSGPKLGILTCSGAECGLSADAADASGVEVPPLTENQSKALNTVLEGHVVPGNPLDSALVTWGNRDIQSRCYAALMSENVDAGLLLIEYLHGPSYWTHERWDSALLALADATKETGTPAIVVSSLPDGFPAHGRQVAETCGLVTLFGLDDGIAAFGLAAAYGRRRTEILAQGVTSVPLIAGAARADIEVHVETLTEIDSKAELEAAGLPVAARGSGRITDVGAVAQQIGFPVVLKGIVPGLVHKTEAGGVALGLTNAIDVTSAAQRMSETIQPSPETFLIERMVTGGVCEVILGVVSDPQIGPVLVMGSGGIFAELIGDRVVLPIPTNEYEIGKALATLKVYALLQGYRSRPQGDIGVLIKAAWHLADYAEKNRDRILEIDVNPLIVLERGKGCVAVDSVITRAAVSASINDPNW
ncbi:MAG: acetate--CoA ligase family protein [Alphaproteobacteria bacterium]